MFVNENIRLATKIMSGVPILIDTLFHCCRYAFISNASVYTLKALFCSQPHFFSILFPFHAL